MDQSHDLRGGLKGMLAAAAAAGLMLSAAPAFAQFGGPGCNRAELQQSADDYIAAQESGEPAKMHFTLWVQYTEQLEEASMMSGFASKPQKIDYHRAFIDAPNCQVFIEEVITDPAHPYVVGVALRARGGQVNGIDMLITDKGDWLFNADNTLKYAKAENWSEIPEAQRDSRETLQKAADAYLDLFNDKTVQVPWGSPCERLEGGMYTGKGAPGTTTPDDSCSVGVPSGVKIVERRYIIDEVLGVVTVINQFGNNSLPDAHTFRIEHGKLRYVHTITVCKTDNCGFKLPPQPQNATN